MYLSSGNITLKTTFVGKAINEYILDYDDGGDDVDDGDDVMMIMMVMARW